MSVSVNDADENGALQPRFHSVRVCNDSTGVVIENADSARFAIGIRDTARISITLLPWQTETIVPGLLFKLGSQIALRFECSSLNKTLLRIILGGTSIASDISDSLVPGRQVRVSILVQSEQVSVQVDGEEKTRMVRGSYDGGRLVIGRNLQAEVMALSFVRNGHALLRMGVRDGDRVIELQAEPTDSKHMSGAMVLLPSRWEWRWVLTALFLITAVIWQMMGERPLSLLPEVQAVLQEIARKPLTPELEAGLRETIAYLREKKLELIRESL